MVVVVIVVNVAVVVDARHLPLKFGQYLVSDIKDVIGVVVNVVIFVVVVDVVWSKFGKKQWWVLVRDCGVGGGVCVMTFSCQTQLMFY